jgi:hypothetical protein
MLVVALLLAGCTLSAPPAQDWSQVPDESHQPDQSYLAERAGTKSRTGGNTTGASAASAGVGAQSQNSLRDWQLEAARHSGPFGRKATIDVGASSYEIPDAGAASTRASSVVHPRNASLDEPSLLFLRGVELGDGTFASWVVLEGAAIEFSGGAVRVPDVERVNVSDTHDPSILPRSEPGTSWSFPSWPAANDSIANTRTLSLSIAWADVSGYSRAVVFDANHSARELGPRFVVAHVGAVQTVSATVESNAWTLEVPTLRMSGKPLRGGISFDDGGEVLLPRVVMGSNALLNVSRGSIASISPFRVTQAMSADGTWLPARVEARLLPDSVEIVPGGKTRLTGQYRESSYQADAILRDIRYRGQGSDMVTLRPAPIPQEDASFLGRTVGELVGSGELGGVALLAFAPALPFLAIADGLRCMVGGCSHAQPTPLFPAWVEAGKIGEFTVDVDSKNHPPGDYPVEIVLVGENYDEVVVSLVIGVAAPPPEASPPPP